MYTHCTQGRTPKKANHSKQTNPTPLKFYFGCRRDGLEQMKDGDKVRELEFLSSSFHQMCHSVVTPQEIRAEYALAEWFTRHCKEGLPYESCRGLGLSKLFPV